MPEYLKNEKQLHIEGLYTFYYLEHTPEYANRGERHDFWEIVYVDSGEISVLADSKGYRLNQGEIIFHKPMEFHNLAAVPGKPHNILVITFECQSPAMKFFANRIFSVNKEQKQLLTRILGELEGVLGTRFCYYSREPGPKKLTKEQRLSYQAGVAYLENFLLHLLKEKQAMKRTERESARAKKNVENDLVASVKEYLGERVYGTVSLSELCARFRVSKSYLCQLFKNETGKSLLGYYQDLKMKEAKYLIREGKKNFTQIAEALGFSGPAYFSRVFKEKENMSPGAYLRSIRGY